MFRIYEMRANETIHSAAQELKKYLSMMMPEGGYSVVSLDNQSTDGFRLGLLEDFGLPCELPDPVKDDVIHIETNENSGILAGSNPRSVLFAVYRYLRENGCRWLYPGIDGDYIPTKFVEPVSYHHAYENRYRGFCDEGWTSQTCMLENIEYYAKLELNNFNLEFFVPTNYYGRYYAHTFNDMNRLPEDVSDETILQWRRQCEVELNKRGMIVSGRIVPVNQIAEIILRPAAGMTDQRLTVEFVRHPDLFIRNGGKAGTELLHIRILRPGVRKITVIKFFDTS